LSSRSRLLALIFSLSSSRLWSLHVQTAVLKKQGGRIPAQGWVFWCDKSGYEQGTCMATPSVTCLFPYAWQKHKSHDELHGILSFWTVDHIVFVQIVQ
jgi:subtilisin family serine protease